MELIKKSERKLRTQDSFNTWKSLGATFQNEGRFMKWKDVSGSRLAVKFDVYKVHILNKEFNMDSTFYVFSDTLDRIAFSGYVSYGEVCDWLREHDYKSEKEFCTEDLGMSKEAYQEWVEGRF